MKQRGFHLKVYVIVLAALDLSGRLLILDEMLDQKIFGVDHHLSLEIGHHHPVCILLGVFHYLASHQLDVAESGDFNVGIRDFDACENLFLVHVEHLSDDILNIPQSLYLSQCKSFNGLFENQLFLFLCRVIPGLITRNDLLVLSKNFQKSHSLTVRHITIVVLSGKHTLKNHGI